MWRRELLYGVANEAVGRMLSVPTHRAVMRVAELKRVHAEGRAAELGAQNPYYGQIVLAAVWLAGYFKMLDACSRIHRRAGNRSRGTPDFCLAKALRHSRSQRCTRSELQKDMTVGHKF